MRAARDKNTTKRSTRACDQSVGSTSAGHRALLSLIRLLARQAAGEVLGQSQSHPSISIENLTNEQGRIEP